MLWRAWVAIMAIFFFSGGVFGIWASRIPSFVAKFDLSPGLLGILLLLIGSGAIVAFPIAGRMVDKIGARSASLFFMLMVTGVAVLVPIMPNVWLLGANLLVLGAGFGAKDVAMNAWGAEVEKKMDRAVMSGFHASFSLGGALGALSGYWALQVDMGIASHFWLALAVLIIVCGPLCYIPWDSATSEPTGKAQLFAIPKGALLFVGIVGMSSALGEGAMIDWSALMLQEIKGADTATAALAISAFSAAMVVTRLSGSVIIKLAGPVMTARLSAVMACIGGFTVLFSSSVGAALIGFGFFGLGYAMIVPLAFSRAANDPEVSAGVGIASVATLTYGGMLLGPPIIGAVAELTSLSGAVWLLIVLSLVTFGFAGALKSQD